MKFKMRQTLSVFILLASLTAALGQSSEVRQVGPFKGIKAGEAISVTLKKGDKEGIKVEVDGAPLNAVITEVSGNYLKIHMAEGSWKNRKVNVTVTYVSLERVSASSACSIVSEGTLKTEVLDVTASSAASVELTVDAGRVTVDVTSAGDIILEGKAKGLTVEATSAGVVNAYNMESETVDVSTSSAGSVKVNVTKELRAEASSGGTIRYRGNPGKSDTRATSGGSVRKTD